MILCGRDVSHHPFLRKKLGNNAELFEKQNMRGA